MRLQIVSEDSQYRYYEPRRITQGVEQTENKITAKRTIIIAQDRHGKVTFRAEASGMMSGEEIAAELRAWCVNTKKEIVTVKYI